MDYLRHLYVKFEFAQPSNIAEYPQNWLRGRDIVEFLGLWESLHNPDFKLIEFDKFKDDAGSNAYDFRENSIVVTISFNWINTMGDKSSEMGNKTGHWQIVSE